MTYFGNRKPNLATAVKFSRAFISQSEKNPDILEYVMTMGNGSLFRIPISLGEEKTFGTRGTLKIKMAIFT